MSIKGNSSLADQNNTTILPILLRQNNLDGFPYSFFDIEAKLSESNEARYKIILRKDIVLGQITALKEQIDAYEKLIDSFKS